MTDEEMTDEEIYEICSFHDCRECPLYETENCKHGVYPTTTVTL